MEHNNPAGQEPAPARAAAALDCPNPQCSTKVDLQRDEIERLRATIGELEAQLRLREPTVRKRGTERTWPDLLRTHLRNPAEGMPYEKILRLCCREENMSSKTTTWVHPQLRLIGPGERDVAPEPLDAIRMQHRGPPFPFQKLPITIQMKVLSLILHKEGQLIHCCSRLDPFVAPDSFPSNEQLGTTRSGLPKRFWWGDAGGECSLTRDGVNPKDFLSILKVSKRFCFLGTHIFFAANTFAFSSLGELGRFCQGSGLARVARMQHVELLLTGSQYLVCHPARPPKNPREWNAPFSRRSFPLSWFGDMLRLKTLAVHVNETSKQYIRRKREHTEIKAYLRAKTAGQPNTRDSRNLRCLQGLDYIWQLRGLSSIRFYDFEKSLRAGEDIRQEVQDWSFSEELSRITTQPKPPKRLEHSRLEKLPPLFGGDTAWTPTEEDRLAVEALFDHTNGRCSYDELLRTRRDNDLASYLGAPSRNDDIASESDNLTDSTPEPDSSSSSSHSSDGDDEAPASRRRRPAQRPRRNSPHTQSSLFGSRAGSSSAPLDTDNDDPDDSDSDSASSSTADAAVDSDPPDSDSASNSSASSSLFFNRPGSSRASPIDLSRDADTDPDSEGSDSDSESDDGDADAERASTGLFVTPGPGGPGFAGAERASTGLFVTPGPGQQGFAGDGGVKREGTAGSGQDDKGNVITNGGTGGQDVVDLTGADSDDDEEGGGVAGGSGDRRKKMLPLRDLFGGEDSDESDSEESDDESSDSEDGLRTDSDSDGEDGEDGGLSILGVKRAAGSTSGSESAAKRARLGS